MKSAIIFFNAITSFKSDLGPLKNPGIHHILCVNSEIFSQLTEKQRNFFDRIHIIDPMTFATTSPFVERYAREIKKENLRLVTNDECCTPFVGKLIDYFGLIGDGENAFLKFINKIVMKDTLSAQGIRTPYHYLFDKESYRTNKQYYIQEIEKKFKYPFILKPVSLYGAASVKKVHNKKEWFIDAEQAAHSEFDFQIEEFISGDIFHCDAIVKNSKIIFNSISEYIWPIILVKKGYPTGSIWLSPEDPRWNTLNEFHQQVIRILQPPDGATHCELFLTENNKVVFLEIAARPSGALVVAMIEKITGVNIELDHFKLRLQRPVTILPRQATTFSLFCYIPKKNGTILTIELPILKSEIQVEWHVKPGDIIKFVAEKENDILLKPENIAATIILNNANYTHLYDDFLTLKYAEFIKIAK